jgi:hypothetical protein
MLGVRRALSGAQRDDIAREIESSILDRVEERYPQMEEISEKELKAVLEELGSPFKLAGQFSPQRYLIGPQFFHIYTFVLRIVVPVVVGALLLSLVIGALTGNRAEAGFPFWEYLGSLWNGAFMAAAFVTLVFAIMERVNTGKEIDELKELEQFKVEDLPELSDLKKQPSRAENIIEIVFGVLGLAFFTYLLNNNGQFPIYVNPAEKIGQVSVFTENFLRFVPAMMALAGIDIARNATLLAQDRHSSLTNWWQIMSQIGHVILSGLLLSAFPLLSLDWMKDFALTSGWNFAQIENGANLGLKVILVLAIIGSVVEIIKWMIRELSNPAK